jgi:hypothetical protein
MALKELATGVYSLDVEATDIATDTETEISLSGVHWPTPSRLIFLRSLKAVLLEGDATAIQPALLTEADGEGLAIEVQAEAADAGERFHVSYTGYPIGVQTSGSLWIRWGANAGTNNRAAVELKFETVTP